MNRVSSRLSAGPSALLILMVPAVLLSSSILSKVFLPVPLLVTIFWTIFLISMLVWGGRAGTGVLPRFVLGCYSASFVVFFEYLFSDYSDFARGLPMTDELASDRTVVGFTLSCGTLGLIGMVIGLEISRFLGASRSFVPAPMSAAESREPVGLGFWIFCYVMPAVCTILVFLSQPRDTILTMAYSDISGGLSRPFVGGIAFDGMGYIVYIWLAAVWIASEQPKYDPELRRKLRRYLVVLLVFIVVFSNLLKGSRTVAGLLAAVVLLYFTERPAHGQSPQVIKSQIRSRMLKVLPWGLGVFLVFMIWGEVRATYVDKVIGWSGMWERISKVHRSGEWVAGIFAMFGMAEEYLGGTMQYLRGQTYIEYLLSLPPSPVANMLDYERPINSLQGPSWWYQGFTVGGMNATIVPFKNFGPVGVLIHMIAIGVMIGWVEVQAVKQQILGRLFFAGFVVGCFHWFWYGDMYIIRVIMIVLLIAIGYRIFLGPLNVTEGGRPTMRPGPFRIRRPAPSVRSG